MKKNLKIFFIFFFVSLILYIYYSKTFKNSKYVNVDKQLDESTYNSNIINDVKYTSVDSDGNEYIIEAKKGEIDFDNTNLIYLTDVNALIKLNTSEKITIYSKYGKYNLENYDTIFSKNVLISYNENKIVGEYLDFSLARNLMSISKNVVYSNINNDLKADVIEINIRTKDTKIFMYEEEKKVNIKSKN